jgi:two-component system, OmpR family, sensor histidine kinase BaeS
MPVPPSATGRLRRLRSRLILSKWLLLCLIPWQQTAREKGLAWQLTMPDSLPTLLLDPDPLGQAVGNLLSNAIKYTAAGGLVAVVVEQTEDHVLIRVSDSGPGIEPHEQARIFEPFYRSHSQQLAREGMGIGLTIARELVVAHGGRLHVESTPGHGSHFTIWLPVTAG